MFKIDTSDIWEVDKAAESLNISLFGSSKSKRSQVKVLKTHLDQNCSAVIQDSDDETFTKKGKRKMKERRRKMKKHKGETTEDVSEGVNSTPIRESCLDTQETKRKKKGKKEKPDKLVGDVSGNKDKQRPMSITEASTSKYLHQNGNVSLKKKAFLSEKNVGTEKNVETENTKEKSGKKRKRLNSGDALQEQTLNKRIKQDIDVAPKEINSGATEGKKKRKRQRKKKNNCKPNKYKHLALNAKSKIAENAGSEGDESMKNRSVKEIKNFTSSPGLAVKDSNAKPPSIGTKAIRSPEKTKAQKRHEVSVNKLQKKIERNVQKGELVNKESRTEGHKQSIKSSKVEINSDLAKAKNSNNTQKNKIVTADTSSVHPDTSKSKLNKKALIKMLSESQQAISMEKRSKKKKLKAGNNFDESKLNGIAGIEGKDTSGGKKKNLIGDTLKKTVPETKKSTSGKKFEELQKLLFADSGLDQSAPHVSLWGKATDLGQQAKEKLDSARFRFINEQLYSCEGSEALNLFKNDHESFHKYHQGFMNQVVKWPVNPVDVLIKQIKEKASSLVVADFGCGDARLAESIPQKTHSFDLIALNKRVTACDMSKTPLSKESVNIAVFCLSLMGTNLSDYILEANRILITGGLLKIVEVTSRFSAVSRFISAISNYGFLLLNKRDLSHMFYMMDFKKIKSVKKSPPGSELKLKPCIYKRR